MDKANEQLKRIEGEVRRKYLFTELEKLFPSIFSELAKNDTVSPIKSIDEITPDRIQKVLDLLKPETFSPSIKERKPFRLVDFFTIKNDLVTWVKVSLEPAFKFPDNPQTWPARFQVSANVFPILGKTGNFKPTHLEEQGFNYRAPSNYPICEHMERNGLKDNLYISAFVPTDRLPTSEELLADHVNFTEPLTQAIATQIGVKLGEGVITSGREDSGKALEKSVKYVILVMQKRAPGEIERIKRKRPKLLKPEKSAYLEIDDFSELHVSNFAEKLCYALQQCSQAAEALTTDIHETDGYRGNLDEPANVGYFGLANPNEVPYNPQIEKAIASYLERSIHRPVLEDKIKS